MENNLNYKGIDKYSNNLAKHIGDQFYTNAKTISGKEILELTPIKQINLFIVKNLFTTWQNETENIKSPYFDYEDEDVKLALKNFMNVLSKNISVHKKDLMPILHNAIKETILLIFSPYDFYIYQFATSDTLTSEELNAIVKYVKINEDILKSLMEQLKQENIKALDHEQMVTQLNKVFENTDASPVDVEQYRKGFSDILELDESVIYGAGATAKTEEPSKPIAEVNETNHKVLNDELIEEVKTTIADIHQNQKIDNIERHLTINQRFMFIRVLFDNDVEQFNSTIKHIESLDNFTIAKQYITEEHSDWDQESEEVEEFMEIVEKRLI